MTFLIYSLLWSQKKISGPYSKQENDYKHEADSVPDMGQPSITAWQLSQLLPGSPLFSVPLAILLTGIFPSKGDQSPIPSWYLLLVHSKLVEFEMLINTQMKISSRQCRVQSWEWRYKIRAISTEMKFKVMGLDETTLFKPHIVKCPL